jgi:hypothetical protein
MVRATTQRRYLRARVLFVAGALLLTTLSAWAQEPAQTEDKSRPQVLVGGVDSGALIALDNKFSEVDGRFANFIGVYGGWLVNKRFLLGGGIYGKTTNAEMGYGGLMVEYFFNPNGLVNFSARGLVGGGGTEFGRDDPFFVVEPVGTMNVNITEWMRLGVGGGYRFVRSSCNNDALSGWSANIDLKFGTW